MELPHLLAQKDVTEDTGTSALFCLPAQIRFGTSRLLLEKCIGVAEHHKVDQPPPSDHTTSDEGGWHTYAYAVTTTTGAADLIACS